MQDSVTSGPEFAIVSPGVKSPVAEPGFLCVNGVLIGHGVFDFVHRLVIDNPGVPHWWPGFCLAFDALLGVFLAARLIRHPERVSFERT
jgi:hypothetical protein